jgi:hypothetical protein
LIVNEPGESIREWVMRLLRKAAVHRNVREKSSSRRCVNTYLPNFKRFSSPCMRLLPSLALLILPGLASALPTEPTKPMPRVSKGFLENKGQVVDQEHRPNAAVRYLWEGSGYKVQLRHTGFSYDHYQLEGKPREEDTDAPRMHPDTAAPAPVVMHLHRVDMELLGMNMGYGVETLDQLPGHFNFYTAGTPYGGATHVQHYGRVRYTEVYPGIDIEFVLDREHGFKYNVIARPGADLGAVRMRITGPLEQHVEHGEVVMQTRFGEVREAVPHSYWRTPAGEVPVEVGFVDLGDDTYGLKAASAAPTSATLVVDPQPEVLWATWFGDSGADEQTAMAVLPNGGIVLAGYTWSVGLGSAGTMQPDLSGSGVQEDGLMVCFDANGGFEWATYVGGTEFDGIYDAAAVGNDEIIAMGMSQSPDLQHLDSAMVNPDNSTQGLKIHAYHIDGTLANGSTMFGGYGQDTYQRILNTTAGYYVIGTTAITNLGTPGTVNPLGPGYFIRLYDLNSIAQWTTYVPYMPLLQASVNSSGEVWMALDYSFGILKNNGTVLTTHPFPLGTTQASELLALDNGKAVFAAGASLSIAVTPNALQGIPHPQQPQNYCLWVVDSLNNLEYFSFWGKWVRGMAKAEQNNFITNTFNPLIPTLATPFCDTIGQTLLTKFNENYLREWSAYIGNAGTDESLVMDANGVIWASFNLSEWTDSTSFQPEPDSLGFEEFSVAKIQPCTSGPLPALGPVTGAISACSNTPVTYSLAPVPGVNYYFWQPPPAGSVVSGQGTTTAQIRLGTIPGFVRVMAMDSCGIGPVSSIAVGPYPVAQVSIAPAASPAYLCPNDSLHFTATANGTVLWSNGATGNSMWTQTPGNFSATVTTMNGCTATSSITNVQVPNVPQIQVNGPAVANDDDTLTYTVGAGFNDISTTWFISGGVFAFQGTLIVNAHWTTPGLGYVAVHRVNQHNCDVYDTLFVQVNSTIGIQEQALVPLQVYPNPASTQVTVVPGGQWRPGMRYAVLNALGQEVLSGAFPASGVQPVELSTRCLSAGVYTLRTTLDGRTDAVVRLVVER